MRRSHSLKAPRSAAERLAPIVGAAALLAASEIVQAALPCDWAGLRWIFAALRMAVLLGVCALLRRSRAPARDGLTGAASYEAYAHCLAEGVAGERVCVFFLDVDDLKGTNDHCGHEAGDRLLLRLAASLAPVMGARDRLFRVGGDEFVLLAADMAETDVPDFLRRWRAELSRLNQGQTPPLTVSCGWAAGRGSDFAALVRRADDAMYQSKNENKTDL